MPCDPRPATGATPRPGSRSGISLFEMLIVLAIFAGVAALTLPSLRGPSPTLLLARTAAEWSDRFAQARDRAVRGGRSAQLDLRDVTCDPAQTTATFYRDGTLGAPDLCLAASGTTQRLRADPLTGRLYRVAAP